MVAFCPNVLRQLLGGSERACLVAASGRPLLDAAHSMPRTQCRDSGTANKR